MLYGRGRVPGEELGPKTHYEYTFVVCSQRPDTWCSEVGMPLPLTLFHEVCHGSTETREEVSPKTQGGKTALATPRGESTLRVDPCIARLHPTSLATLRLRRAAPSSDSAFKPEMTSPSWEDIALNCEEVAEPA